MTLERQKNEREKVSLLQEIHELQRRVKECNDRCVEAQTSAREIQTEKVCLEFALKEAHDRTLAAEDNARFLKTECESRRKETLTVIRKDYDERLKHVEHEHKVSTPTPQPNPIQPMNARTHATGSTLAPPPL